VQACAEGLGPSFVSLDVGAELAYQNTSIVLLSLGATICAEIGERRRSKRLITYALHREISFPTFSVSFSFRN
jgi:hypothetical protein